MRPRNQHKNNIATANAQAPPKRPHPDQRHARRHQAEHSDVPAARRRAARRRAVRSTSRGRKQGAEGKPREDAESPDSEELGIGEEIERRARQAAEEYRASLELYESRIRDAIISSELRVEVESAGERAVSDFSIRAVNDANHLATLEHEAKGRDSEYRSFRSKHRLERLPKIVSPRERFFRGTIIAIFIVLESVLNGLFFAEGSEAGLIGGFVQAVVLSILNIGAAILFAIYGLRLLIYRKLTVKAVGLVRCSSTSVGSSGSIC